MAVICYDKDGKVLKNFTQWDTGQTIAFDGVDTSSAPEVHFGVQNKTMAYKVDSTIEGGMVKVTVPNTVLREPGLLTVWLHYNDGEGGQRTEARIGLYVLPKQKPADYDYDDNMGADGAIGDLDDLLTDYKQNLVGAINEVHGETDALAAQLDAMGGKLLVFAGCIPQTAGEIVQAQFGDLIPEQSVRVGCSVIGNNGYIGTVTELETDRGFAAVTAAGLEWSEIGYTDLGSVPSGSTIQQFISTIRPEGMYRFVSVSGDSHYYLWQREVLDNQYHRSSYRVLWYVTDDGMIGMQAYVNGTQIANVQVGPGGVFCDTIGNSSSSTGLVNKGYVDNKVAAANRPQLRSAAATFDASEGTALTIELADISPEEQLAVGDVLLGMNGYTATVTGTNEDMVYTSSRGVKFDFQAGSVFYAVLKDFTLGTGGTLSGGRLLTTYAAILAAYEAGCSIQMDMVSGNDQYHEIIPLSYVGPGKIMFDRVCFASAGSLSSTHVELAQDGTISGQVQTISSLDNVSF